MDNKINRPTRVALKFVSPFGYTHPDDDKRQMCPFCYNEDTQRITDVIDLQPYVAHHNGKPFKAYSCDCCGGKWHWCEWPNDRADAPATGDSRTPKDL